MRAPDRFPRLTDRLPLGPGLEVSPFALGLTRDPATVIAAYDAGINFFFLSGDLHWPLYAPNRDGLATLLRRRRGARDRIVVAVASYATQPEFSGPPFVEVLAELPRLQRLDVMVIGGAHAADLAVRLPIYERRREQRYCGARALGCSFHERAAAAPAAAGGRLDIAFVRYNAAHPGARVDLFPQLQRPSSRTLVFNFNTTHGYVPPGRFARLGLGRGHWRPRITDHHRFALSRPEIDGLLCGLATPAEVTALSAALEQGPLDADEQDHLEQLSRLDRGEAELA